MVSFPSLPSPPLWFVWHCTSYALLLYSGTRHTVGEQQIWFLVLLQLWKVINHRSARCIPPISPYYIIYFSSNLFPVSWCSLLSFFSTVAKPIPTYFFLIGLSFATSLHVVAAQPHTTVCSLSPAQHEVIESER